MAGEFLVGIGALFAALAFGLTPAMTVFIGRMAFQHLEEADAKSFLRVSFPIYHAMQVGSCVVAGLALATSRPIEAVIMGAVAFIGLFAWLWLMPVAHRLADLKETGQDIAKELLQVQGRSSFIIVAQLAAMATVVVRLAIVPTGS